jgi:hypothetical protein
MRYSNNRTVSEKVLRDLWAVDATVAEVQTQPTRMRFAIVWKDCEQQWFQKMTRKALRVATMLLSHQINEVESTDSPNNDQHEFLGPDSVLHLLGYITSRYAPFRGMMKFQNEPPFVPSHMSLKFIFLVNPENGW